jgi:hypothetical protein
MIAAVAQAMMAAATLAAATQAMIAAVAQAMMAAAAQAKMAAAAQAMIAAIAQAMIAAAPSGCPHPLRTTIGACYLHAHILVSPLQHNHILCHMMAESEGMHSKNGVT